MSKLVYFIILLCFNVYHSYGQIAIGTKNPDISSLLEINSTTLGFLPPRMTQAQRDAIAFPTEGLFIYNTDSKCFQYYISASWSACLKEIQKNELDCNSVNVNGTYTVSSPLNNTNTITIDVLVGFYDTYNITTNTVNGYSFSASGAFPSLGVNTITLTASGTPLIAQTDTFTIDLTGTGFTCHVNITSVN
ncbi:hypothetical protein [Flavivirga jejuensis]|uniref:Uncharacterized protein n=1 Tax=Flavivirga jejuensis TaxID=870487 RepID=A0ABT8WTY2_9FLAO|nr:hypothetical protein [Flavivirga jejuensis]MDO5976605.1 hypothetical protein [Flavivirga jejuensis]